MHNLYNLFLLPICNFSVKLDWKIKIQSVSLVIKGPAVFVHVGGIFDLSDVSDIHACSTYHSLEPEKLPVQKKVHVPKSLKIYLNSN
jgi:hypothetical protein